ncbi:hypothetical protein T265_06830 [Opisthorchis viverrini]|uniref:Uncharacterized protein n=1 Tax=Opisthorchis viverrini TaxID=6198 RepID=A0A074ZR34_OPIVI|nr:hypothetical protein T265_06830 [Opisthorchis viverrini]KER25800.1 hypothetical protein T265_06830 [Opisthorchis viverrini]
MCIRTDLFADRWAKIHYQVHHCGFPNERDFGVSLLLAPSRTNKETAYLFDSALRINIQADYLSTSSTLLLNSFHSSEL